jgi:Zn-dependent peptidase ImmA (M78 family)
MVYEGIIETAKDIISTFGTKDPFKIAQLLEIPIIYREYGDGVKGYCIKIHNKVHIIINSRFDRRAQKIICAHELGHALLHTENLTPVFTAAFKENSSSILEYEANLFAAIMLLDEQELNVKFSEMSNYVLMGIFNENLRIDEKL